MNIYRMNSCETVCAESLEDAIAYYKIYCVEQWGEGVFEDSIESPRQLSEDELIAKTFGHGWHVTNNLKGRTFKEVLDANNVTVPFLFSTTEY